MKASPTIRPTRIVVSRSLGGKNQRVPGDLPARRSWRWDGAPRTPGCRRQSKPKHPRSSLNKSVSLACACPWFERQRARPPLGASGAGYFGRETAFAATSAARSRAGVVSCAQSGLPLDGQKRGQVGRDFAEGIDSGKKRPLVPSLRPSLTFGDSQSWDYSG